MAGTSEGRVRLTNNSGSNVADVDAKGVKQALATYLVDSDGNQITSFGSTVTIEEDDETILTTEDANGRLEYLGWAAAGSDTVEGRAAAIWKVIKISYTTNGIPSVRWAQGVTTLTNVWDDRETYTYS